MTETYTKYDEEKAEKAVTMLLEAIGHPKDDENLKETPKRVAKMYAKIFGGYEEDPKLHLKLFPSDSDTMVVMRNIPIYSHCIHHLAPFSGRLTIAYIPNGKLLGLSKLIRIARIFAKRLQLQENLTSEIANFLNQNLPNKGVAVNIRAHHSCVENRGARATGAETTTTKLLGEFLSDPVQREEFLRNCSDKEGYNT